MSLIMLDELMGGAGGVVVEYLDLAGEAADLQIAEGGREARLLDLDADDAAVFRQVQHDALVRFPRLRGVLGADFDIERIHVLEIGDVHDSIFPRSRYSISAFCTCRRFSASSHTTDCGPSITAAVTSSPRCAGRQCMKTASDFATAIMSASTCQSAKAFIRSSFSASQPMLVHTSVVTRSAPRQASIGSAKLSKWSVP